jgi:translation initiation factor 1
MSRQDRLVYSSARGRLCAGCARPVATCVCRKAAAETNAARGDGVVRVRREVKGRRGKTVTTLSGVPLGPDALRDLAAELKRHCGTGGSSKDGVIEIQGDHRERLVELLEQRGYRVVRAGG